MKRIAYRITGFNILMIACFVLLTSSTQLLPTNLRITVLNSLGNAEEGVTVTLYATEENYIEEKNPVQESQLTDAKGRVTFTKLQPKPYFVVARKGDLDNNGEGAETAPLQEGRMNKVNIVIQ
ncbi:MAG: carboxypeptidase regulatory-like domain-containing protein [Imperialibacter sp.]|uniref:carboxypeptidase regulatory-like domain-containing protein n=1 Tax=Imperialibacter sp. TaxID=2038411 RepID=UPI0030DC3DC2